MHALRLSLLLAATNIFLPTPEPLRVMRVTPTSPASPDAVVTVTFDRPVAGGLDASVDARAIFRIEPAVEGRVEWRDPVTLRFTPASPLVPGATYAVTVAPDFRAMDGSRLAEAYRHIFRVGAPRVLTGSPAGPYGEARYLAATPTFSVLVSAPVEAGRLASMTRIQLDAACGGRSVAVRAVGARRVGEDDAGHLRYTGYRGPYPPDTARDLRRVVDLVPESPLPLGCGAALRVPEEVDPGSPARQAWRFATYGPLRMVRARCAHEPFCPTGPVRLEFSTPVRGAEVLRRVSIAPMLPFTVRDTLEESAVWVLDASLQPRRSYAVVVDSLLTDVFGQRMRAMGVHVLATTGYAPSLSYPFGRLLVERNGFRTLAVQHVNVGALQVTTVPVPDTMEAAFLGQSWGWEEPLQALRDRGVKLEVPVGGGADARRVSGVRLSAPDARRGREGTLLAVRVGSAALDSASRSEQPVALVQVTDLGVHARVGADEAMVWVTGVQDGRPRPGAAVTLHDARGRVRARGTTDARGLARLTDFAHHPDGCEEWRCESFEGYVAAELGDDRALVGISAWDPDLAPWRFGIDGAWGSEREPLAAAVFTERGIYRPGEPVYAKAIVRTGPLGALSPPRGDSLRWVFNDREGGVLEDTTVALSAFGTADHEMRLAPELPLGSYQVQIQGRRAGQWRTLATAHYQVAEYRPPEFLVDVTADPAPRLAGDSAAVQVSGRYLFGAPMARSPVRWQLRHRALSPWEFEIPGAEDFYIGASPDGWDGGGDEEVAVAAEGADTLDAAGRLDLRLALPEPAAGRPSRASILASVTDANRQTVAAGTSVLVHPAAVYIGAKPLGERYFWSAGTPVAVEVVALRPDGGRVEGVAIEGVVVRREWHRVRRTRGGAVQEVGGWVADTVATCRVVSGAEPVTCGFTPPAGGSYSVTFSAADAAGRRATTRFGRWASGRDWVPWNDDTQLKMDVVADRPRYAVGDTATVFFASPFTDAEAWVTVERERVLESRRIRIASGATTLKFPITEAYAPNAFVSIVVVRGRSAPPGPLDDPGRPAIRVGYAELRVTPEVKRLAVEVRPLAAEYRPGDTAAVRVAVRDGQGRGRRAEVTLWAVDQGVLALTGYRTPDPIDLLYPRRGLGVRLASNLVNVAPQVPEGEKGKREPGGGGGADLGGILRSRFQTTAFFLGSVVTGEGGEAVARAKLPDNLTTFRVMAVAVTEGDRYGAGESELLVTRPLVARPALPRFVREGDRFAAGVVVNSRMGGTPRVEVTAEATGIRLEGGRKRTERLAAGRGLEARFEFRAQEADSARFRFALSSGREADAVALAVPVRPSHAPLAQTIAGVLRDTASAEFLLGGDVDPARSRLEISFGSSPLAFLRGARRTLRVYPYFCTEQVISTVLPLIALHGAGAELAKAAGDDDAAAEIAAAVRTLSRRQRPDGGIGYWSATDWTSPWLSAYAGRVLLEARKAGVPVEEAVLERLADYLRRSLREQATPRVAVARWWGETGGALSERLAAADLLSRLGQPDIPAENTLLAQAARLRWEDRLLLAEMLARRGPRDAATRLQAVRILAAAAAEVRIEGRRAVLPAMDAGVHYFASDARPAARLLDALIAIEPASPLVGPVVETLTQQGKAEAARAWNTQDYGAATLALMNFETLLRATGPGRLRITAGRRTLLDAAAGAQTPRDTALSLEGLVGRGADGRPALRLDLRGEGDGPLFYYLTVRELPRSPQLTPVDRGIQVERWYEDARTGRPVTRVAEGELVRVRLRLTVPAERHFVVLEDPLPAGLEPVDLSLRTVSPFGAGEGAMEEEAGERAGRWSYGSWDSGMWSPFDHKELRDDRVVYAATVLWPGSFSATYLARATTAGTFRAPPARAEEMYNPGVNGRSGGAEFVVTREGK